MKLGDESFPLSYHQISTRGLVMSFYWMGAARCRKLYWSGIQERFQTRFVFKKRTFILILKANSVDKYKSLSI